ncbi:hypothetical protein SDC9_10112 [bioreactor metagenome]|uniref:Uncharacterized protein n=1 Tax=bioreactor metagenome TaxID=1076179 RepID=A0A644TC12_9ZZZZ
MGEVGDGTSETEKLRRDFDAGIAENENRSPDGENPVEKNSRLGIEHGESQEQGVYRPRRTQKHGVPGSGGHIDAEGCYTRQGPSQKVEKQELLAPHASFHRRAEDEQAEHVHQKMGYVGVGEHIAKDLPYESRQQGGRIEGHVYLDQGKDISQGEK